MGNLAICFRRKGSKRLYIAVFTLLQNISWRLFEMKSFYFELARFRNI